MSVDQTLEALVGNLHADGEGEFTFHRAKRIAPGHRA